MRDVFLLLLFFVAVFARSGLGPTDQQWGHVTVREDAHVFWWLHTTSAQVARPTDRPLVVWLQGGPGASSSGYGNFLEVGPLDADLRPRETTWLGHVNVLFVDSPVGAGYSYVERSAYATSNRQIAEDFLELLKGFYATLPEFEEVPLYIFSESYGGKMAAEIALVIHNATNEGNIRCNLRGIGLGDPWISPIDSVKTWAPYLLNLGLIDEIGYEDIMKIANETEDFIKAGNFRQATDSWEYTKHRTTAVSNNVNFYNVLNRNVMLEQSLSLAAVDPDRDMKLSELMNGLVKKTLNISQHWQIQNEEVYDYLREDFMKPVIDVVGELLDSTDIKVVVYNGQFDLIVDTIGTMAWIEKMDWKQKPLWESAERKGFVNAGYYEGYVQKYENFALYWVDRSGHMVASDNPSAMYYILKDVTDNFSV